MDTLTHIVLGACIGEAMAGKQLGKKALIIGALAQNIPDADIIASFWLSPTADLLAHRAFTHSILFVLLLSPLLAYGSQKIWPQAKLSMRKWILLWGVQMGIHIFIDAFNAYGTGWFEPFSHYRVSFNTLYVADPLFTIWPAVAMVALLIAGTANKRRMLWAKAGIGLSAMYLLVSIGFKQLINNAAGYSFAHKGIAVQRYFTTPTPLNSMLWNVTGQCDSGYYIGYRSVWDKQGVMDMHFVRRNEALLNSVDNKEDVARLKRFSQGYYVAGMAHDTVVFNDLRFGEQLTGRAGEAPRFVFYYHVHPDGDNKLPVQRGRFAGWDKATVASFIKRIRGI